MKILKMKYVIAGGIILLIVDIAVIILAFVWY